MRPLSLYRLPQGLCTGGCLCLECFSPSSPCGQISPSLPSGTDSSTIPGLQRPASLPAALLLAHLSPCNLFILLRSLLAFTLTPWAHGSGLVCSFIPSARDSAGHKLSITESQMFPQPHCPITLALPPQPRTTCTLIDFPWSLKLTVLITHIYLQIKSTTPVWLNQHHWH